MQHLHVLRKTATGDDYGVGRHLGPTGLYTDNPPGSVDQQLFRTRVNREVYVFVTACGTFEACCDLCAVFSGFVPSRH